MTVRLLLVEDDPTTRTFLCAASEALPAMVDTADTIAAALALAVRHDHALWMIDANLPDGTGIELLSMLRAKGLSTPALAHTATDAPAELDALLAAGFASAVAKPLAADAWREALRGALGQLPAAIACRIADAEDPSIAPVWNDNAALAAMNGNRTHVDALRKLFLHELPTMQVVVSTAFAAGDVPALQAELHKLHASCGFVGARRLDAAVRELRAAPLSAAAMSQFESAVQDMLSS